MSARDYLDVTEVAGEPVSREQIDRMLNRYVWACSYCQGKDVAEIACGTGPGLGLLQESAKSVEAGDFSSAMVQLVRRHYGERIEVRQFDAQAMPYAPASKDVLILFEAIYYIPRIEKLISECRRVLRHGGKLLLATANKDLEGFNPSPYSHRYLGTMELAKEFSSLGSVELFGYLDTTSASLLQRSLVPIKGVAVRLGLMPKTMAGKRLLKRLVFGKSIVMPAELQGTEAAYTPPTPIPTDVPDRRHKVIYCVVSRKGG